MSSTPHGQSTPLDPDVQSTRILGQGHWMKLREIRYTDAWGAARVWECAERCNDRGAVVILARLTPSSEILLIRQYRPPVDACTLEFPAGLVDEGESAEETALRELREETGYEGRSVQLFPEALTSPGLTNEAAQFALVEVDLNHPANAAPTQRLEGSERIEVFRVCESDLPSFLEEQRRAEVLIDMRVLAVSLSLQVGFGRGGVRPYPRCG